MTSTFDDDPEAVIDWDEADEGHREVAAQLGITLAYARDQYPYAVEVAFAVEGNAYVGSVLFKGIRLVRIGVEFRKYVEWLPDRYQRADRRRMWEAARIAMPEHALRVLRAS